MARSKARTRKDVLHVGTPLWLRRGHVTVRAAARIIDKSVDVVVVGAGISGALVAEALTRSGKSVLIVDRRLPLGGSTAASTAILTHELDIPLIRLGRRIGPLAADAAWRRSVCAINALVALVAELKIACAMRPVRSLYLAGNTIGARGLAAEAEGRRSIGIQAAFLRQRELQREFGIERTGAILSVDAATADPVRLTVGLLRIALARGASLAAPVEITDMGETVGGVALATRNGKIITARHAVFCTGYEYLRQMKTRSHHVTSTWAIASQPGRKLPSWLRDTVIWEGSNPYLYIRTDQAGRIIAGGEDEEGSDANSDRTRLARKSRIIAGKIEALLGIKLGRVGYEWSAPFSVTDDALPIIDRVPGFSRIHTVMGFGGNGITFSLIGAQVISAMIAGEADPDAALFRFR